MNLAISNIAWSFEEDSEILPILKEYSIRGLEVAPTRIFAQNPYRRMNDAKVWADALAAQFGLPVVSMQSILFGCGQRLFGTEVERNELLDLLSLSYSFAEAISCPNLVFGSPKNRILPDPSLRSKAIDFFRQTACVALEHHVSLNIEANPEIYGTNFINTTSEAVDLIREVNHPAFCLNLDVGTIIQNKESLQDLERAIPWIRHIHISEPYLEIPQRGELWDRIRDFYRQNGLSCFLSVEMKRPTENAVSQIRRVLESVQGVFSS